MKKEDFKDITEEHIRIAKMFIENDGDCGDCSFVEDCNGCPLDSENATNGKGCKENNYNKFGYNEKSLKMVKTCKEFIKIAEER